jgi:hypothetical protein
MVACAIGLGAACIGIALIAKRCTMIAVMASPRIHRMKSSRSHWEQH